MKKIALYILFCVIMFSVGSCKKFLAESSQDEIRPSSTEDLQQLMYNDAYPYITPMDTYTDLLTDDIQSNGVPQLATGGNDPAYSGLYFNGVQIFTWNPVMFDEGSGVGGSSPSDLPGVNSWKIYYTKIKGCNVVLDYIDKVSGTQDTKNAIKGQALFLRAYYYLKLVMLYGQPYSGLGIDPKTSLGVPLVLNSAITDSYPARNTLAEVYSQIEKDLLLSADLLKNNNAAPNSVFRVGTIAVNTILSRLYLYMGRDEDMDNVILYAGKALADRPNLTQLVTYFSTVVISGIPTPVLSSAGIYDQTLSQEVIWSYGVNPRNNPTSFFPGIATVGTNINPPFTVSAALVDLYDRGSGNANMGDLRFLSYFNRNMVAGAQNAIRSYKIGVSTKYGDKGLRVAELYLNRAEASVRRYKKSGQTMDMNQALRDLNTLRQSRYDTRNTPYLPVNITNADELFKFCQDERRRELCLEDNSRWSDIKRWGLSVTHRLIDDQGVATNYTLNSGSWMYALPLPYDVVSRNFNLKQNPR